jgi:hypothetical protein
MDEALMVLKAAFHLYFAMVALCVWDAMPVSLQRLRTTYASVFLIVPFADWYSDLVIKNRTEPGPADITATALS